MIYVAISVFDHLNGSCQVILAQLLVIKMLHNQEREPIICTDT